MTKFVHIEYEDENKLNLRQRRLKNLLAQITFKEKPILTRVTQKVPIEVGLNLFTIKNKKKLSSLNSSICGVLSDDLLVGSDEFLVVSKAKPKFPRPMYRFAQVLFSLLMFRASVGNLLETWHFIQRYMMLQNCGKYYSDNPDFDYSILTLTFLHAQKVEGRIIVCNDFNCDLRLIEQLSVRNYIIFLLPSNVLPSGLSRVLLKSHHRLLPGGNFIQQKSLRYSEKPNKPIKSGLKLTSFDAKFSKIIRNNHPRKTKTWLYGLEINASVSNAKPSAGSLLLVTISSYEGQPFFQTNIELEMKIDSQYKVTFEEVSFNEGIYTIFCNLITKSGKVYKTSLPTIVSTHNQPAILPSSFYMPLAPYIRRPIRN